MKRELLAQRAFSSTERAVTLEEIELPAGVEELTALRRETDARAAYMEDCRAVGQTELTVPILPAAKTRFNLFWGDALSDLMQNPTNERNVALAYYYGVNQVRGDPDMTL